MHAGAEGGATTTMSHPVVVKGSKAVEHALLEGQCPVVDQNVDVFAIASAKGLISVHLNLSILFLGSLVTPTVCSKQN